MVGVLSLAAVVFGSILFVLLIRFWRAAARSHRQAKEWWTALVFLLFYVIFGILQLDVEPGDVLYWIFQFVAECCGTTWVVLMGVFWSHLTAPSAKSMWIMLCLIGTFLDLGAILVRIEFPETGTVFQSLYNATSIAYFVGLIGLGVGLGIRTYWSMYQFTRERTALLLLIGILGMNVGWVIGFIQYVGQAASPSLPDWWPSLRAIDISFTIGGYVLYGGVVLAQMDYFYRLPFDVYLLLVMSRLTGLPAYEAVIKAEKPIQVDPPLLAGLFTAMNTIFQEIGHKQVALESVAGPGLRFLIEWGNEVATLVMTDRDTYYLRQAVKQFTRDFEAQYASQIKSGTPNLDAYDGAEEIIKRNFPFFTIAGG